MLSISASRPAVEKVFLEISTPTNILSILLPSSQSRQDQPPHQTSIVTGVPGPNPLFRVILPCRFGEFLHGGLTVARGANFDARIGNARGKGRATSGPASFIDNSRGSCKSIFLWFDKLTTNGKTK